MAFDRPTLPEIISRTTEDLGPAARLRRSPERALARSIAGVSHGLHGHLDWASRQVIPTTADDENLVAWAAMFAITRKQPTKATTTVEHDATNGTEVPEGTIVQIGSNRYVSTADVIASGGTVEIEIEAEEAGADWNVEAGAVSRLVSPIAGVNATGLVLEDAEDGTDIEELEDLRDRLTERLQSAPRGGSSADYIVWAKETPGVDVREAWVFKDYTGDGTIGVCFVVNAVDPIPSGPQVTLVQDYVESKAPAVLRDLTAFAPIAQPVAYDIDISPYPSAAVQAAITAALDELHLREAEPGGSLLLSRINEAISTATGEIDHVLVSPVANVDASTTISLLTRGSVTYGPIP